MALPPLIARYLLQHPGRLALVAPSENALCDPCQRCQEHEPQHPQHHPFGVAVDGVGGSLDGFGNNVAQLLPAFRVGARAAQAA